MEEESVMKGTFSTWDVCGSGELKGFEQSVYINIT
jgi:hypothetical protein